MLKKLTNTWYYISVYIVGLLTVVLAVGEWGVRERMLLASAAIIFLHFFEEFAFPGGFPWVGMKVELGLADDDPHKWPLNQVNAWFGNWWFAVFVYLLPLFLPDVRFLTLAAAIFAFLEVLMHLIFFNIKLRVLYNPGLVTAVFGLLPISLWYFSTGALGLYGGADWALAILWVLLHYFIGFRSPIYTRLGRLSDRYAFTAEEVGKARPYIDK